MSEENNFKPMLDEDTVKRMIDEAKTMFSPEDVFNIVTEKMDLVKVVQRCGEGQTTIADLGQDFAYVGFMAGIEFALRNVAEKEGGAENG